jgi:hypothetical protein
VAEAKIRSDVTTIECAKSAHSRRHKPTPEEEAADLATGQLRHAEYTAKAKQQTAERRATFELLDAGIRPRGGIVVHTLAEMVPLLDDMQPLLSRKDAYYDPDDDLPKWAVYLRELAEEFQCNFRTILAHLQKYRADKDGSAKHSVTESKWNMRTQHQAAKALEVASKLVASVKIGLPVKPLVREWDAVAFTPEVKDTLLARVDPVTEFLDGILTPYIASMLQYVRSLEDAVFYHAPTITDDREHRVWAYEQQFYDVPPELKQVFAKARHQQPARECSQVEPDGTPIGEEVRLPHPAPSSLTAGQGS